MNTIIPTIQNLDNFFENIWRSGQVPTHSGEAKQLRVRPRVDIHEEGNGFQIDAELPGFRKEDVQVEIEGSTLILRASRKEAEKTEGKAILCERFIGREFHRSFSLGKDLDASGIEARMSDGVLSLRIPRAESALPRRIEIA